jgi:hypothetical protein
LLTLAYLGQFRAFNKLPIEIWYQCLSFVLFLYCSTVLIYIDTLIERLSNLLLSCVVLCISGIRSEIYVAPNRSLCSNRMSILNNFFRVCIASIILYKLPKSCICQMNIS